MAHAPHYVPFVGVLKSCMYYGESANIDPRENLDLPFNPDFPEKCQLPEYLVVNVCVPHYEPGLLQNATEGPSTMLMAVCKITDECVVTFQCFLL